MAEFEVEFSLDTENQIDATFELLVTQVYSFEDGLTQEGSHVRLNKASKEDFGGVIVGENIEVDENAVISILDATEENKGVIRIASEEDIEAGTETRAAVTPKQLAEHSSGMEEEIKALDEKIDKTKEELEQKLSEEKQAREDEDIHLQNSIYGLDVKVDQINLNLTNRIQEVQDDLDGKYEELINDIDELTDVVEEDFTNVNQKIDDEIFAREQADTALGDRITALDQSLSKDIDDLDQKLSQEISDLDDKLSQDIEDEVTAREQADTTLQGNINTLSTTVQEHYTELTEDINHLVGTVDDNRVASENRDKALGERIDNISQQELADKEEILKAIQDEITARTSADITLDNKYAKAVSDEATAREQADTTLDIKITTETKKVDDRLTEVAEEINRSIEDNVALLEGEIDTLENRVDTVEDNSIVKVDYNPADVSITLTYGDEETEDVLFTNLVTNAKLQDVEAKVDTNTQTIATEITNRTQADNTLQNNIDNLTQIVTNNYNDLDDKITEEASTREGADSALQGAINTVDGKVDTEISNREQADSNLQEQIDALVAGSDVKDIVGTYEELQNYDKSTLGDQDIIKVLEDSTQNNASTYYRYHISTTSFTYIGKEGPFYTKSETDEKFVSKTRTINNKNLSTNIVLTPEDIGALPDDTFIPEKVTDLTDEANYVKFTDTASASKTGVIKTSTNYGTNIHEGALYADYKTLEQYKSADNGLFIGRATLEAIKDYLSDGKIVKKQGAPLPVTEGTKGLLYEDVTNGDLYQCTEAGSTYTWVKLINKNDLDAELDKKQDNINDLADIRNNALAGKAASETIATYGNIVTHNAEEFQEAGDYATNSRVDELEESLTNNLLNYDLKKVDDYLYEIHYSESQIDYQNALEYFKNNYTSALGGCTSIRKDNYFGRNYDWTYSNSVSFIVKKEAGINRYASIGLASVQQLTKSVVEAQEWNDTYKILPYFLLDGMNEHGLTVSMNVVPSNQKGKTTGTHPELSGDNICMLMLPSYLLDNFKSAVEAVSWIDNIGKIYAPIKSEGNEELHFLIADKNDTFVVEFIDNVAKVIRNRNYITNFYLDGTTVGPDGKIEYSSVTPYGQGLERYDIVADFYSTLNSSNDVLNLMRSLNYTNAYNADDLSSWWKTEFVAPYAEEGTPLPNLTVTTPVQEFVDCGLVDIIENKFRTRSRDKDDTWQTVHTSVYDLENKEFLVLTQEQDIDKVKTFQLFPSIGNGSLIITKNSEVLSVFKANQQLDTTLDLSDFSVKSETGNKLTYVNDTLSLENVEGNVLSSVNIKQTPDVDDITINLNDSNQLQAIGHKTINNLVENYWTGTKVEYEQALSSGTIKPETLCNITDDLESVLFNVDGVSIEFDENSVLQIPINNDYVIYQEKNNSGEGGLRLYRSGYLEQWGVATSSIEGALEFELPRTYKDINFSVFLEIRERGNYIHYAIPTANNKFEARIQTPAGVNSIVIFQWRTFGYTN